MCRFFTSAAILAASIINARAQDDAQTLPYRYMSRGYDTDGWEHI